jgi:hypothetical protein
MLFMSEGQGLSAGLLEGLSLKIIVFKFEDNSFKKGKINDSN